MSTTSRIAAAQDGLLAAIAAQQAGPGSPLAGVQLALGHPIDLQAEAVWVADDASSDQAHAATSQPGSEDRGETIELQAKCFVVRGELDYKTARDRALALAGEVEDAVRADRSLGGAVFDAETQGLDLESGVDGENRLVGVTVRIRSTAYLS